MNSRNSGLLAAIAACTMWGVLPIYWKLLAFLPPFSIVAQRTLWSLLFLTVILLWRRELKIVTKHLRSPKAVCWQLASGLLLAMNWVLYVWATLSGHIVEAALGYYLNPFFNMLFGAIWFGESHSKIERITIALAIGGVILQLPAVGHFPWIAFTLAIVFSLYGVIKKRAPLGSRIGLTAETGMLAPIALGWLIFSSNSPAEAFGGSWQRALLIAGCGLVTTLPLVLFGYAAKKIRLTTLGIIQFIGPTLQFLIGWLLYAESMTGIRLLSFALIWLAIGIFAGNSLRKRTH